MTVDDKKSKKFNQNNTMGEEDTFPVKGEDSSEKNVQSLSPARLVDSQITSILKGDYHQVLDTGAHSLNQRKQLEEKMQRIKVPKNIMQPMRVAQKEEVITSPLQVKTLKSLILNQSERSSGKIRYQVAGKEYKISDKRGRIKAPSKDCVPDQLDEIILSQNDEAEEVAFSSIQSSKANDILQNIRYDPYARVGARGEILLKEMKFLSIESPRGVKSRDIQSNRKNQKYFQDKNKSVNATLVPILPPPKLVTPKINQSPRKSFMSKRDTSREQKQLDCQIPTQRESSKMPDSQREQNIEAQPADQSSAQEDNANVEAIVTKVEVSHEKIVPEPPTVKPSSRPKSQKSSALAGQPEGQTREDLKPSTPKQTPTPNQENEQEGANEIDHTTEGHTVKAGEFLSQHGATLGLPHRNESGKVFQNNEDTKESPTRHHAELLKLNLEINLSALQRGADDFGQDVQMISAEETTEDGPPYYVSNQGPGPKKGFTLPNHRFSKKFQPIYVFRDELDVSKDYSRKHNDVVSKVFGARSLSLAAKDQTQTNNRISELLPPNKVYGAPDLSVKLKMFHKELSRGFYSHVSPQITSRGTTGKELGTNSETQRQNFASTLNYGIPRTTVIADNRSTSLFRDYYKVIGSRYKYELEDLLVKQQGLVTQEKYMRFCEKLSAQYMANRNSPNEDLMRFTKYQQDCDRDRLFENKLDRSSPMTPSQIGRGRQDDQTPRKIKLPSGPISFIPGSSPRTVQYTPNTASDNNREGALTNNQYRTLTEGQGQSGTATGRQRNHTIAEGQSSLFGGTQLKQPTSSAGRSKEHHPAPLPALSQCSKTSTMPKAAPEPETSSIEDSVLKGKGMRLGVQPKRQIIPLKETQQSGPKYHNQGSMITQFDSRFTDWNNLNQLSLKNQQLKPVRQDTLKAPKSEQSQPDNLTQSFQEKNPNQKLLSSRNSPFQNQSPKGNTVEIVLSRSPISKDSSGDLQTSKFQTKNNDLEVVKAKSQVSQKPSGQRQALNRNLNRDLVSNRKNMEHIQVIEPNNQFIPQSELSVSELAKTQRLNIKDILSPADTAKKGADSRNSFYKERKSALGSSQPPQRGNELVSIVLQNAQHTPDPRFRQFPEKFAINNLRDRQRIGGKFYKKEYQEMQLIGQPKRLQSRSPSDSRSPTGSFEGADGVKVIQDRVFQPYSPETTAFGVNSGNKSGRETVSPAFGAENVNIATGQDKNTPLGHNALRTQQNGSLEKLTVIQRVASPIDRIIITQAHSGSGDLQANTNGVQDLQKSGKGQATALSTEPDNQQNSKNGSLVASSGAIREGLIALESSHNGPAPIDQNERDSQLEHHDPNEMPHVMEARGGNYPTQQQMQSKSKSKFGKQASGGVGQDQTSNIQKAKMVVQPNQQFLPAPKINPGQQLHK